MFSDRQVIFIYHQLIKELDSTNLNTNLKTSIMQNSKRISSAQKYSSQALPELPYIVRKPICLKSNTYSKNGHWTEREKLKFCIFMDYHKQTFNKRQNRRLFKIFKYMAQFVKSRNANQCRSHHQKMQKQFEYLDQFIQRIKKVNGKQQYENYYILCAKELQTLDAQMKMNMQEDQQEDANKLPQTIAKDQKGYEFAEQKSKDRFGGVQNVKQQKQKQDLPTTNTYSNYGSYATTEFTGKPYQKNQRVSLFKSFQVFNNFNQASSFQVNQSNAKNFLPFNNLIGPQYNFEPNFSIHTFQNFNGFSPQPIKHESQRQKLINQCNYFWKKYLQSSLKLQQKIKEEASMHGNQQYTVQEKKNHFLYDI